MTVDLLYQAASIQALASGDNFTTTPITHDMTEDKDEKLIYYDEIIEARIYTYCPPFILIFGIFGNILSFLVFSMKQTRKVVSSFFFRCLAISDIVSLLPLTEYFLFLWSVDSISINVWACNIISYLMRLSKTTSAWLLVFISIERCVGIYLPHKAKVLITNKRARVAFALLFIILMFVYSPVLVLFKTKIKYDIFRNRYYPDCSKTTKYVPQYKEIFPWLETILYSFAPFILLGCLNIAICIRLLKVRQDRQATLASDSKSDSNMAGLTAMLLLTSFSFIVLTLPDTIYYLLKTYIGFSSKDPGHSLYIKMKPFRAMAFILHQLNHGINFVLYCMSGKRFRSEVKAMFCGRLTTASSASNLSSTTNVSIITNTAHPQDNKI